MKLIAFQAESADAALAQIHQELGPEAVVVSVKQLPPEGISRLWQRNGLIEVTACLPQKPEEIQAPALEPVESYVESPRAAEPVAVAPAPRPTLPAKPSAVPRPAPKKAVAAAPARPPAAAAPAPLPRPAAVINPNRCRSLAWLESKGLLPTYADQLEQRLALAQGKKPSLTPEKEWAAVTGLLTSHWRPARPGMANTSQPHVFIGPAGSGKTTALCKWMTSAILLNEQRARVWRLDGESANLSELLTLHCETMGVPMERFWSESFEPADLLFVDLPGVEYTSPAALAALREQLAVLPQPHVHLVLNAACDSTILFDQFSAFESFAPEDVIFTHLDEERQRVKLWNWVLGTNVPISFLSAGQKIPGDFRKAEPALLFPQKNQR